MWATQVSGRDLQRGRGWCEAARMPNGPLGIVELLDPEYRRVTRLESRRSTTRAPRDGAPASACVPPDRWSRGSARATWTRAGAGERKGPWGPPGAGCIRPTPERLHLFTRIPYQMQGSYATSWRDDGSFCGTKDWRLQRWGCCANDFRRRPPSKLFKMGLM